MTKQENIFVLYQGRNVPREHFRVWIYSIDAKKIVNSYSEYEEALNSGKWFSTKEEAIPVKPKKVKSNDSNSERVC